MMKTQITCSRMTFALPILMACFALILAMPGCNGNTQPGNASNAPATLVLDPNDFPPPVMTLYQAVAANNIDQVKSNIAHGADLNELVPDEDRGRFSSLHAASRAGYFEIMKLLIAAGADLNIRADAPHRATPLHWAARSNHLEGVKILVEAGADVNARAGVDGNLTPMRTAVDRNLHDIVQYLANNGAQM